MIGDSDDKMNFPHELLLTNRQVANIRKAFANNFSTDTKLSKTQISKMIQSEGFLGRLLSVLLKIGLPLKKNVIKPLAKSVLIPLGLIATASVADAEIYKKVLGSVNTKRITSNDETKEISKIVKSLEDSGLLFEGVSEKSKKQAKEQKGGVFSMVLSTLGAILLGDVLTGRGIDRAGEGIVRAGYGDKRQGHQNKMDF